MIKFLISHCLVFDHREFPIHSSIPFLFFSSSPKPCKRLCWLPVKYRSDKSAFRAPSCIPKRRGGRWHGGKHSSQVEVSGEISPPFCHVFWGVNENGSFHHFAKATDLFLYDFFQLFYIFMFFSKSRSLWSTCLVFNGMHQLHKQSENSHLSLLRYWRILNRDNKSGGWDSQIRYMNMWNKYSRDNWVYP